MRSLNVLEGFKIKFSNICGLLDQKIKGFTLNPTCFNFCISSSFDPLPIKIYLVFLISL